MFKTRIEISSQNILAILTSLNVAHVAMTFFCTLCFLCITCPPLFRMRVYGGIQIHLYTFINVSAIKKFPTSKILLISFKCVLTRLWGQVICKMFRRGFSVFLFVLPGALFEKHAIIIPVDGGSEDLHLYTSACL